MDNLKSYTQVIVIDVDNVNDQQKDIIILAQKANEDKFTYLSFVSPSGDGLKIFIKVSSDFGHHNLAFKQLAEYYSKLLDVQVDESGKDVNRLCFVSYDENAYLNSESKVFDVNIEDFQVQELGKASNDSSLFSQDAQSFAMAVKLTNNKISFIEGDRNNFVMLLASNCNRLGVSIDAALHFIKHSEFCYDEHEVIATIYSAYKNVSQHNTFPKNKGERAVAIADVAHVAQQRNATRNQIVSFRELAERGKYLQPLKKIFGNFLLEKSTTLFPSERGIGKSLLAMQIAFMVASNSVIFLGEKIELHGNVLYLNLELGDHSVSKRMETLYKSVGDEGNFEAYCMNARSEFFEAADEIRDFCVKHKPVLIIIDNLRCAFVGKDNERNKEMSLLISEINKLKDEFDCAFLIVHHVKKGSSNQLTNSDMQSGAGALTDLVDADFFLRRSGVNQNYRILKRVKSRECEEQDGAKLIRLNPETLWFEFLEDGVDESNHVLDDKSSAFKEKQNTEIERLINEGFSDIEIANKVNLDRSTIYRRRLKVKGQ